MRKIATLLFILGCHAQPRTTLARKALGSQWTLRVIQSPVTHLVGADGEQTTTIAQVPWVCGAWEQGDNASLVLADGTTTTPLLFAEKGAEDVRCNVDLDHDGKPEVVTASQSLYHVKIGWSASNWMTVTTLDWAHSIGMPKQPWMQLDFADVNENGVTDIVLGGRNGAATFGWLDFYGDPHVAANWTYHPVGYSGWTMALRAYDANNDGHADLFLTDRAGGQQIAANKGAWIYLNDGAANFTPVHVLALTGDVSFGDLTDVDQNGFVDVAVGNRNALYLVTQDQSGWTVGPNLKPTGTGDVHGVKFCHVADDVEWDLVVTYALADPGESWVQWIGPDGVAHEISGPADVIRKPDQPECVGSGPTIKIRGAEGGDADKTNDIGQWEYSQ